MSISNFLRCLLVTSALLAAPSIFGASVYTYHNSLGRDGNYQEARFASADAAALHRDTAFSAHWNGAVYAQPLYIENGPGGRAVVLVATEQNEVLAIDAGTGQTVWARRLGSPVPSSLLPCGNIDPLGITGTPVVDPASHTIYLDAATTPDGHSVKHLIYALSLNDGSTLRGWPIDTTGLRSGSLSFEPSVQNQRGALALVNGTLYVPYGGHWGDCGEYHGWVIGVPVSRPSAPLAWATRAQGGGIWAPGGVASDGTALFIATGNTFGASAWQDGEAIIRFDQRLRFGGSPTDFFTPANWRELDESDQDLGGSGPLLVHVPGATTPDLIVSLGKDGNAYLLDHRNLGGIGHPLAVAQVSTSRIINGAATYTTKHGTYVVFKGPGNGCPAGQSGDLTAFRLTPSLGVEIAWCANEHGRGSPIVASAQDAQSAVVWTVGAEGDNRLHGFDGDTGRPVFDGDATLPAMARVARFQSPIIAGDAIFVAANSHLYKYTFSKHK